MWLSPYLDLVCFFTLSLWFILCCSLFLMLLLLVTMLGGGRLHQSMDAVCGYRCLSIRVLFLMFPTDYVTLSLSSLVIFCTCAAAAVPGRRKPPSALCGRTLSS